MKKVFLDLNILFDLIDTTRSSSATTIEFIKKLKSEYEVEFFASDNFVFVLSFILRRKSKDEIIDTLVKILDELDLNLLCFKKSIVNITTLFAKKSELKDVEDLLMLFMAIEYECEVYVTNDKEVLKYRKDFLNSISIITPKEFI
jgi:predicted nucleic acid-binding protein